MVLYLASDESEWVTGTAMIVDGGLTVGPMLARPAPRELPQFPATYIGPSFKRVE